MDRKPLYALDVTSGFIVLMGWIILAVVFFLALPLGMRTDYVMASTVAAGLAWFFLVEGLIPFFLRKSSHGDGEVGSAFHLTVAVLYALGVAALTVKFAFATKALAFNVLIILHVCLFGAALVANLVSVLTAGKARQVAADESDLRQGLVDIRAIASGILAMAAGSQLSDIRESVTRLGESLRYTSPSGSAEARASEERLNTGLTSLRDSLSFMKSLGTSGAQSEGQMQEIKLLLRDLESEAQYRSRMIS